MTLPDGFNVKTVTWYHREQMTVGPAIRIYAGQHFVIIPIEIARSLVDAVHDCVDDYERALREKGTNDHDAI